MTEPAYIQRRRDAFRRFLKDNGWKVSTLVRRAYPDLDAETRKHKANSIYNFLNNQSKSIGSELLLDVARAAGVDPDTLYGENVRRAAHADTTNYIIGEVQAGVYKEALQWPEDEWQPFVTSPPETHVECHRFWLRVVGNSMNLEFPSGTVLECVHAAQFNGDLMDPAPRRWRKVIACRKDDAGMIEATCKELHPLPDRSGAWLWPRSTDPEYQQPLFISADDDGGENQDHQLDVRAVVIRAITPQL